MRKPLFVLVLATSGCIPVAIIKPAMGVLKGITSFHLPSFGETIGERVPSLHMEPPAEISLTFPSKPAFDLYIREPTGGWTYTPPTRRYNAGMEGYTTVFTHRRSGARIHFDASVRGGDDAIVTARQMRTLLWLMGIPVYAATETKYQSLDDWSIHRADFCCLVPPPHSSALSETFSDIGCARAGSRESMEKKLVMVSFHDPRLAAAASALKITMRAEWPRQADKTVARALHELSAYARIKSGL
ncbi:MAG: hypothetical protein AAB692_01365 [Patescibacteria group bacterium]